MVKIQYKHYRLRSITVQKEKPEDLGVNRLVGKKINKKKEKIFLSRLMRTGVISITQYRKLFKEDPYITSSVELFSILDISSELKKFSNIHELRESIFISHKKHDPSHKLYHNYTNLNNIIQLKDELGIENNLGLTFDMEYVFPLMDKDYLSGREKFFADAFFIRDGYLYFIETDMGTEKYSILKQKDKMYEKFYKEVILDKKIFKGFKMFFYTGFTRTRNLQKNKIFNFLENNDLIEFKIIMPLKKIKFGDNLK